MVENGFWETIPSIIAAITSFTLALYLLYRNGANVRIGLAIGVAVMVASVAIQQLAGWTVLGTVLGLSNGLYLGPSVIAAWRSHTPVGISPATWWLTVLEGLKWGFLRFSGGRGADHGVRGRTAILLALLVLLRLRVARDRIRAALASAA